MDENTRHLTASVAMVAATPVAVWWVVGDLSERGTADLDYMFQPLDPGPVVTTLAGVIAVAVVLASATFLGLALHRGRVARAWSATVVPLCAAGAIVGYGWRILTAGGIGANIGGAMFMFFGLPTAVALAVGGALNGLYERRRVRAGEPERPE